MKFSMVFINIGWMLNYEGPSKDDPIRGGHKWLQSHPEGHEAWNFAVSRGRCFGYVPGTNNIDVSNFVGATKDSASGVTVVWVARHPELGRHVVVGWYRNATIFRHLRRGPWTLSGSKVDYQIVADAQDAFRVRREQRTFPTPRGPAIGFGRSVIFYGNDLLRRVIPKFIESNGQWQGGKRSKQAPPSGNAGSGQGRQQDAAERKRIEKAAIDHATRYYRVALDDKTCVTSVETECKGWDLEIRQRSGEVLLVEVKGTASAQPTAELTVNEYKMLRDVIIRHRYVLYLVTHAGTPQARAHIFHFRAPPGSAGHWQSDDGRVLQIKTLEAARVTAGHAP